MNQRKYGVVLSYVSLLINNIVGLLFIPFMLRMLGPAEYGLYSIIGSFAAHLSLMDMGMASTAVRYISKYRANEDKKSEENFLAIILIIYSILVFLVVLIGLVVYRYLPYIFKESLSNKEIQKASIMFIILVGNIAFTIMFNAFTAVTIAYERFVFLRLLNIGRILTRVTLLIILLMMGYKAIAVVIVDTLCNVIFSIIKVNYTFRILKIKIKLYELNLPFIKEIFSYAFFIFLNVITDQTYWKIDNVILGIMTNSTVVAVYAIGSQMNIYYMSFSTAISSVFLPKVVNAVEKKATGEMLTDEMVKTGRIQMIILGLILTGFGLFGEKFILLWAGPEYQKSYLVALIVMVPLTVPLFQNIGISILQAKNKHRFRSLMYLIISVINIFLTIILVNKIGMIGAAIGTAVALIAGNIIGINIYYHKVIGLNMPRFFKEISKGIIPSILIALVIGIFIRMFDDVFWMILFGQILIYTICYSLLMWFIGMNIYEKKLITGIFNSIKSRRYL